MGRCGEIGIIRRIGNQGCRLISFSYNRMVKWCRKMVCESVQIRLMVFFRDIILKIDRNLFICIFLRVKLMG